MNRKAKGNRQEHRCMKALEAVGYSCCRSAASLGIWDVIAKNSQHWRVIQVKSNRPPCSLEMEAMSLDPVPANTSKELWIYYDGKRDPVIRVLNEAKTGEKTIELNSL